MDGAAVLYASDSALDELGLTAKGDLFALRAFCQKKKKLLEQIFSKRKKKSSSVGARSNSSEKENVKTRKVLLGWLHYKPEKRKYVMIRTPDGGGTRDVDLPHDSTKEDIVEYAVGMFFEGGSSKFGAAENMEFNLGNFKCEQISDVAYSDGTTKPFTLSGYFEATKLKKARLYLMSTLSDPVGETKRARTSSSGDDDDNDDLSKPTFSDGNADKTMKEGGKDKESRKLNSLQAIKAVNIPQLPDPRSDNDSVIVTFEDCDTSLHSRRFLKQEKVIAVYRWIGTLKPMPWFVLYFEDQEDHIPPTQSVTVLEHRLVHVSERRKPVAISDDPEVIFKGFAFSGQQENAERTEDLANSPVHLFQVEDNPPSNIMDSFSR